MTPPPNYRRQILNELLPFARRDRRIIVLVCDMGFGVVDEFKKAFPDRIHNVGVMEQGTVGIAAGMAATGLIPIVYCIVNFLVYRSLEQMRNDVVLQNRNVKFIATGVNDYFRFLGASHCCGDDDIKLMRLINMPVFDPYAAKQCHFPNLVRRWITDARCGYIRV